MKNALLPFRFLILFSCLIISHAALAQPVNNLTTTQSPTSSKDLPEKGVPLAINALTIAAKTYTHEGKITSTGKVEADTKVTFKSAYAIELMPGFVAEKGSFFEAYIGKDETSNGVKNVTLKQGNNAANALNQNITHRLFPNPSSESFTLEIIAENEGKAEIVVFNTLGGVQWTKPYALNKGIQQVFINCNDWATGLYLVSIKINDTVKSERLVINKH